MNVLFKPDTEPRVQLIPRDYQRKSHDESFRLWDGGERGVLDRIATGCGKTPLACMKMKTWLERSPNHFAMIVSYERDLVWQFAQEVYDFLGVEPGIEMGDERLTNEIPRVVVACRPSLLPLKKITAAQAQVLMNHGIKDCEWLPVKLAKKIITRLEKDSPEEADEFEEQTEEWQSSIPAQDEINEWLQSIKSRFENSDSPAWSRLHKFDWRLNWLVIFDEAHRHAHSLRSVGHIVDWFDRNPLSKRSGLTATPKRGDGISIGHKMFPAVSIDYPLFHVDKPCAVKQGWAVPYVQKYIEVEGVDFKAIKKIAGDFDEAELSRILGEEGQLAKLVQPLLDMVGERRTLIFSPSVEMAKNVAAYINGRSQAECYDCKVIGWYPSKLIGESAECSCGRLIDPSRILKNGEQCRSINGETNPRDRKNTYKAHQKGQFQFLSVCGLCREGYNDPDISCVSVFRPVSKKASSLAEQMKGRACRPCRSIVPVLNSLLTPGERVEAIANSDKPNALIVDLVGITGLGDCASTIQIYADGLDDEVVEAAEEILAAAVDEEIGVEEAVEQARDKVAAEKEEQERQRKERAAERARLDASVKYTSHAVGSGSNVDPDRASDAQYRLIALLGMKIDSAISPRRAGRIITALKLRQPTPIVAATNGLHAEDWQAVGPTDKQLWKLGSLRVPRDLAHTGWDASQIIGAAVDPQEYQTRKLSEINGCATGDQLTSIGKDIAMASRVLPSDVYKKLVTAGKSKRAALVE